MPRFSVIIPTHNRADYLEGCLASVFGQNFTDCEVIVVDDGSTDRTPELLSRQTGRIRCLRLEGEKAWAARNSGARIAAGDYLVFLDDDDRLLPWALDVYAAVIDQLAPELLLGEILLFRTDAECAFLSPPERLELVGYSGFVRKDRPVRATCSKIVVSAGAFARSGGFRFSNMHDDLDFLLRAGCEDPTVVLLSPPTAGYRLHDGNTINDVPHGFRGIRSLVAHERGGEYAGGRQARRDRYAVIGGAAFFWAVKSMKRGFPLYALRILTLAWPMILTAVFNRLAVLLRGRTKRESFQLPPRAVDGQGAPKANLSRL